MDTVDMKDYLSYDDEFINLMESDFILSHINPNKLSINFLSYDKNKLKNWDFKYMPQIYTHIHLNGVLQSFSECYTIYQLTKLTNKLEGSLSEVGICGGGSAYIIKNAKNKNKKLYLFDTFEGVMDSGIHEPFNNGFCAFGDEKYIRKIFADDENVSIIKGYFPDVILNDNKFQIAKFAFVHLDVDSYQSTLNSLKFFYNRMIKNGIILSHDYNNLTTPGVKIAFDEFFGDKEELVIPICDSQAMIIKI